MARRDFQTSDATLGLGFRPAGGTPNLWGQMRESDLGPRAAHEGVLDRILLGSAGWLLTAPLAVPDRRPVTYVLAAFAGYSSLLLPLLLRNPGWIARVDRPVLLADLAAAFTLISLTGRMQSDLFPAFYLLTAIHSYCFGPVGGLAVAGASAFLCLLSGWPYVALADCTLRLAFLPLVASALGLLAARARQGQRRIEALNPECRAREA